MAKSLFDPVTVGAINLPNRLIRSATWEGLCDTDGSPTPRLQELYRNLAGGGVGLIISGYTYVRADGKQLPGKMGIDSDHLLPSLKDLTDCVHGAGGKIFCQLVHAGGQTSSKTIGMQPIAPSAVTSPTFSEVPREMSLKEIRALVDDFARGADRARQAGFDGIQLHGAHGYLINQFLSPVTNHRTDDYGGSLENRMRFLLEVCSEVRRAVGADFPVTIKLTGADHLPGGFTPEEAVESARRLDELGIDAIEVSSGTAASQDLSPVRQGIDCEEKEAYNADLAGQIRQAVRVPVTVVGGLRSCASMSRLLKEEKADLFALSRPLIREPDLVKRWQRDPDHRATCISCNGCFRPGLQGEGIYCVVDRIEQKNRTLPV